ncbi:Uncharacterised protein [Alloiococcus otitis]|uniref:Uncharacterized protein n=1 Tax=Alloiococcus otitis ATCC 51267 TaxID=883081 RepID=K9EQ14_9LACT|nr:hypothetical protein [Alloiococcus otitis]EKU92997.1 hypothetical protein HMPREF9698_01303 [Alloiococcus otitis ATCC 51267]SUU80859.1 Uncharacterised protein [Alloiococcus otitis]
MDVTLSEIKRFLKDHLKFITITTIIFTLVLAGLLTLVDGLSSSESSELENELEYDEVLEADSAYFQFYAEFEDGDLFTNGKLVEDYLKLNTINENVYKETNINIPEIEDRINEDYPEFDNEFTVVEVTRNSDSNIFTITVNLGNESNNLTLAEYYYDLLMEGNVDFLENKRLFSLVEPQLVSEVFEEEVLMETGLQITPVNVIKNTFIALIVSLVLAAGLALLKAIFGQKLDYSFAYNVEDEVEFLVYNPAKSNSQLLHSFISQPKDAKKIVLLEGYGNQEENNLSVDQVLQEIDTDKVLVLDSLTSLDQEGEFAEIDLIVQPYRTDRTWYQDQVELMGLYNIKMKVVQING